MAKFVSKENLETFVGRVAAKMNTKISDPGNGEEGQVLVKTEDGTRWETIVPGNPDGECTCTDLTTPELDEILKGVEDTVEFVDLGLPSGLLWATCNLGAEKETDYGLYFQWGDTKGYKSACAKAESDGNGDAHYFDWSKYKHCNGTMNSMTKYNSFSNLGTIDNKTILDLEDDAAVTTLGGQWRMPTTEEFQELIDNTDHSSTFPYPQSWVLDYNGTKVNGILRKSKTNGNTIFFPAAGYCDVGSVRSTGNGGYYWGSTVNRNLYFDSGGIIYDDYACLRCYGLSIRAVKPSK